MQMDQLDDLDQRRRNEVVLDGLGMPVGGPGQQQQEEEQQRRRLVLREEEEHREREAADAEGAQRFLQDHQAHLTDRPAVEHDLNDANVASFGDSLAGNTVVEELTLSIEDLTEQGDCSSVLNFIETSSSLREFTLCDSSFDYGGGQGGVSRVVGAFLAAVSRSTSVQMVDVGSVRVSATSLSSLLRRTVSVTHITLSRLSLGLTGLEEAAEMEAAFRDCRTLESLEIVAARRSGRYPNSPEAVDATMRTWAEFCFRGLSQSSTLRSLTVSGDIWTPSVNAGAALRDVIARDCFDHLCLKRIDFAVRRSSFKRIAVCLRNKSGSFTLELHDCQFDRNATVLFHEFFTALHQGHTLKLDRQVFFVLRHIQTSAGALLERMLQQPTNGLRHLELIKPHCYSVQAVMSALEQNLWLESLVLETGDLERQGSILPHNESGRVDPDSARQIIDSLPHLRGLKKLKIAFQAAVEPLKDQMMAAFRANKSLEEVFIEASFLSDDDQAMLRLFATRNAERRAMFHRLVSLKLWHPSAKMTECETGMDVVFRSLIAWEDRLELNTDRDPASHK
jgi:hypothetical protein